MGRARRRVCSFAAALFLTACICGLPACATPGPPADAGQQAGETTADVTPPRHGVPDDLPWPDRWALLRACLHGSDPGAALDAAAALGPWNLPSDDVRLASTLLATQPVRALRAPGNHAFADVGTHGLGPQEALTLLTAATDAGADAVLEAGTLEELHRALLPEQIPALVALYRRARHPVLAGRLLWTIRLLGDISPVHADSIAEAWNFTRAIHGETAGDALDRLRVAALATDLSGNAIPPALREHALDAWLPPGARGLPKEFPAAPRTWLARTLLRFRAVESDLPFLGAILEGSLRAEARDAALRLAAPVPGEAAALLLRTYADEEGAIGDLATAMLSQREGAPLPRMRPVRNGEPAPISVEVLLQFAPGEAAASVVRRLHLRSVDLAAGGDAVDEGEFDDLRRFRMQPPPRAAAAGPAGAAPWGGLPEETLRLLRAAMDDEAMHPGLAARYFERVDPEGLTPAAAERLARRLEQVDAGDWGNRAFLSLMEGAHPGALRTLLARWTLSSQGRARDFVLAQRARLGDAGEVDGMLASWPRWDDEDALALARVRDPRVEAHLAALLRGGDDDDGRVAATLAAWHGLPEGAAASFFHDPGEDGNEIAHLVLAGEERAAFRALLATGDVAPRCVAALGNDADPRSRALLEELRGDPSRGRWWEATAALARAGDPSAREAFLDLIDEPRPWLLDSILDGGLLSLDGDPEARAGWLRLVASNCCLSFFAEQALVCGTSPFVPWENGGTAESGDARERVRMWFRAMEGRLVRSRILDALVPGDPSRGRDPATNR